MTEQEFWESAVPEPNTGCLLWTKATFASGYGGFALNGERKHIRLAHRFAWESTRGPISAGQHVLHRCDTRACINPDHLFLGTQADNNRDMFRKGRNRHNPRRGVEAPNAKLTDSAVEYIRTSGDSLRALARRFGVSKVAVGKVRSGKTWAHVA